PSGRRRRRRTPRVDTSRAAGIRRAPDGAPPGSAARDRAPPRARRCSAVCRTRRRAPAAPLAWASGRSPSEPDRHALELRVMMQGLEALLASDAALLVAPEGCLDPACHPLVHVDLPGLEPRGDAVSARQVARSDSCRL